MRRTLWIALAALVPVFTTNAFAVLVSSEVSINGNTAAVIGNPQDQTGKYKGVSVAGAQVSSPAKIDRRVSRLPTVADDGNKPANAAERPLIDLYLSNVTRLLNAAPQSKVQQAAEFWQGLRQAFQPTAQPQRFKEESKEVVQFVNEPEPDGEQPTQFRYLPLRAKTDVLTNDTNTLKEKALAVALQARGSEDHETAEGIVTTPTNKVEQGQTTITNVQSLDGKSRPVAVALGQNRDPIGVDWATSTRELKVVLTGLSLDIHTTGPGARAVAIYGLDALMKDGTSDVDAVTESDPGVRSLYELDLFFAADDGSAFPQALINFGIGEGVSIRDSIGNVGLDAVTGHLASLFTSSGFFVPSAYDFTLSVAPPEDPSAGPTSSVLFLREFSAAGSSVVPAPDTLTLLALGLAGLGFLRRTR